MFKVGDKVRLSDAGKRDYFDNPSNPHELQGTILTLYAHPQEAEHDPGWIWEVEWSNKRCNDYKTVDLQHEVVKITPLEEWL